MQRVSRHTSKYALSVIFRVKSIFRKDMKHSQLKLKRAIELERTFQ